MPLTATRNSENPTYYPEINYFRGFVIFSIVLGHVSGMLLKGRGLDTIFANIFRMLTIAYSPNGTAFFVFISGFLFYGVFYKKGFNYSKFIRSKFTKVFFPYLIFAAIEALMLAHYSQPLRIGLGEIIDYATYGSLWYIPFIMTMFLISPFFIVFIELRFNFQIIFFLFFLIIGPTIGRHHTNPVFSCIYFMPLYMGGIFCCQYYHLIKNLNSNIKWSALYLTIAFLACLVAILPAGENVYEGWQLEFYKGNPFLIGAKTMCSFLYVWFFVWLVKYPCRRIFNIFKSTLALLAKYSFTIYFFQLIPLTFVGYNLQNIDLGALSFWQLQGLSILSTIVICGATILIFAPIKKLLGKYSRMIIGS